MVRRINLLYNLDELTPEQNYRAILAFSILRLRSNLTRIKRIKQNEQIVHLRTH